MSGRKREGTLGSEGGNENKRCKPEKAKWTGQTGQKRGKRTNTKAVNSASASRDTEPGKERRSSEHSEWTRKRTGTNVTHRDNPPLSQGSKREYTPADWRVSSFFSDTAPDLLSVNSVSDGVEVSGTLPSGIPRAVYCRRYYERSPNMMPSIQCIDVHEYLQ